MSYPTFLRRCLGYVLDVGYFSIMVTAAFAAGSIAVMSFVAIMLHSWIPLLIILAIVCSSYQAAGVLFIIISTIRWFEDKDSM